MKLLIIYCNLNTGGIETLIVRMTNWLIANGHNVLVLLKAEGELLSQIDHRAIVVIEDEAKFEKIIQGKSIQWDLRVLEFKPDCIYSFDSGTIVLQVYLAQYMTSQVRLMTGVYHERAYFPFGKHNMLATANRELIRKVSGKILFLFMNEVVEESHANWLKQGISPKAIWPLPIEKAGESDSVTLKRQDGLHVVSVGRLETFKTYNTTMIAIVSTLRKDGYNVQWDVYGSGILQEEMEEHIRLHKMNDFIRLKGTLPYQEMRRMVQKADVFVGMGTSLLEAASEGIPSISAIQYDSEGASHGFAHQLPLGYVGEQSLRLKKYKIADLLREIILMTESEYKSLCDREIKAVSGLDIDKIMNQFIELESNAPIYSGGIHISRFWHLRYWIARKELGFRLAIKYRLLKWIRILKRYNNI